MREKVIRDKIKSLEPFVDVTNLNDRKELNGIELARFVNQKFGYVRDPHITVRLIISWGVFTGLFQYDGESGKLMPKLQAQTS